MSDVINKYLLVDPFQNQNAGFSRWTTAKKGSHFYFIKEFMDPKFPDEESLSDKLRNDRIRECREFEKNKLKLYSIINKASDGNLVRITEFFRVDSHYYMTTDWIDHDGMGFDEIAGMNMKDKLLLCRTAAHSLAALHSVKIAHSDIKDTNVLVHKSKGGKAVAKIIDFDCGFFEDNPPENEDDLGGDQVYLSPEACLFFCGEDVSLTCKMDVFAMGLLFHQYLTGELPYFDKREYDYAHEAVLDGVVLKADSADIPPKVGEIIENMLLMDAGKRISAQDAYDRLTDFYRIQYPDKMAGTVFGRKYESRETPVKKGNLKISKDFLGKADDL